MIFQPARQTAAGVTTCPGGLLLHLLTFTTPASVKTRFTQPEGSHSLLCFYALAGIFPFGSAVF